MMKVCKWNGNIYESTSLKDNYWFDHLWGKGSSTPPVVHTRFDASNQCANDSVIYDFCQMSNDIPIECGPPTNKNHMYSAQIFISQSNIGVDAVSPSGAAYQKVVALCQCGSEPKLVW